MNMRRLTITVFFLTACGMATTPVANVSPSSPSAPQSQLQLQPIVSPVVGVFFDASAGKLSMVDSSGTVVASTSTTRPHRYSEGLPWTSASQKRLYYLDGMSSIVFLAPDGTTGHATRIRLAAGEEAGFSVSPDDQKIAVAVLKYGSAGYLGMRIYVENLAGAGNHREIYSSPTVAEYPIAWTAGRLVIAVSKPFCCGAGTLNPLGALEYHVADSATGVRLVTLCHGGRGPIGPPAAIGVTCGLAQFPNSYLRWDGSPLPEPGASPDGALSPDGTMVASNQFGGINIYCAPACPGANLSGDFAGWLDDSYIVYRERATSQLHIARLYQSDQDVPVPGTARSTTYLGTLPTAIS